MTLKDLFEHQLRDLYSAENQLLETLPKMAQNAKDDILKKSFEGHVKVTERHRQRLSEICGELEISPVGEKCKAMEELLRETEGFMRKDTEEDVKNVGLIAEAQRIEHYQLSGYGTAVRYAKELRLDAIAEKLQETLNEEYDCDETLTGMAEKRLHQIAVENA